MSYHVVTYQDASGRNLFRQWFDGLQPVVAQKVTSAILGFEAGNFADSKWLKGGVRERRIHSGPGYRLYYAIDGQSVVLLHAGSKRTQASDIRKARALWYEYKTHIR